MKHLLDKLRMGEWLLCGLVLLGVIAWIAPAQISVVLYKGALVTCFAHLGYWIDRRLAPYGRPEDSSGDTQDYRTDTIRRAVIVAAVILAGAMAL